jgi:hypothetical protein
VAGNRVGAAHLDYNLEVVHWVEAEPEPVDFVQKQ